MKKNLRLLKLVVEAVLGSHEKVIFYVRDSRPLGPQIFSHSPLVLKKVTLRKDFLT